MRKTLLTILLLSTTAMQAAHITDKLLVGVYETPDNSTKPIKVIPSGTPLDIKKREGGYSWVLLGDGSEGWIKSTYITDEKPAKAQLLELQAKSSELKKQLQQTKEKLKSASTATTSSSSDNSKLQQELEVAKKKLVQAEDKIKQASSDLDASKQQITTQKKELASAKQDIDGYRKEIKLLKNGAGNSSNTVNNSNIATLKKELDSTRKAATTSQEEVLMLQDHLKKLSRDAAQEKLAQAEIIELKKELSATKDGLNAATSKEPEIIRAQQQARQLQQRISAASKLLGAPMEEVPEAHDNNSLFSGWHLLTLFLLLLGGFLGGIAFINHRVRKRYGGFRI